MKIPEMTKYMIDNNGLNLTPTRFKFTWMGVEMKVKSGIQKVQLDIIES